MNEPLHRAFVLDLASALLPTVWRRLLTDKALLSLAHSGAPTMLVSSTSPKWLLGAVTDALRGSGSPSFTQHHIQAVEVRAMPSPPGPVAASSHSPFHEPSTYVMWLSDGRHFVEAYLSPGCVEELEDGPIERMEELRGATVRLRSASLRSCLHTDVTAEGERAHAVASGLAPPPRLSVEPGVCLYVQALTYVGGSGNGAVGNPRQLAFEPELASLFAQVSAAQIAAAAPRLEVADARIMRAMYGEPGPGCLPRAPFMPLSSAGISASQQAALASMLGKASGGGGATGAQGHFPLSAGSPWPTSTAVVGQARANVLDFASTPSDAFGAGFGSTHSKGDLLVFTPLTQLTAATPGSQPAPHAARANSSGTGAREPGTKRPREEEAEENAENGSGSGAAAKPSRGLTRLQRKAARAMTTAPSEPDSHSTADGDHVMSDKGPADADAAVRSGEEATLPVGVSSSGAGAGAGATTGNSEESVVLGKASGEQRLDDATETVAPANRNKRLRVDPASETCAVGMDVDDGEEEQNEAQEGNGEGDGTIGDATTEPDSATYGADGGAHVTTASLHTPASGDGAAAAVDHPDAREEDTTRRTEKDDGDRAGAHAVSPQDIPATLMSTGSGYLGSVSSLGASSAASQGDDGAGGVDTRRRPRPRSYFAAARHTGPAAWARGAAGGDADTVAVLEWLGGRTPALPTLSASWG